MVDNPNITVMDKINILKKEMEDKVNVLFLNTPEVLEISQRIDKLIYREMVKQVKTK